MPRERSLITYRIIGDPHRLKGPPTQIRKSRTCRPVQVYVWRACRTGTIPPSPCTGYNAQIGYLHVTMHSVNREAKSVVEIMYAMHCLLDKVQDSLCLLQMRVEVLPMDASNAYL